MDVEEDMFLFMCPSCKEKIYFIHKDDFKHEGKWYHGKCYELKVVARQPGGS